MKHPRGIDYAQFDIVEYVREKMKAAILKQKHLNNGKDTTKDI